MNILVSAGEASGDRYAAELVAVLRKRLPEARFFGAAGPRLRDQGVEPIVKTESLAVVGLVEVVRHIPRIHGEFKRLLAAAEREKPDLAILTDAPDFNLRVAAKLKAQGVPVVYYVAPQVWAWRSWRVKKIARIVDRLLTIFPFEETWFNRRGVSAVYVGHPLADALEVQTTREQFCKETRLDPKTPILALLPGSRRGEALRHLPALSDAVDRLSAERKLNVVLAASSTAGRSFFAEHLSGRRSITVVEDRARDLLAHADAALVASGTATVEAALLGCPLASFYKVTPVSWLLGKLLVNIPFYTMVNLLAEKKIIEERIQGDCTGENLAADVRRLLDDETFRTRMKRDLAEIRQTLRGSRPAADRAADAVCKQLGIET